MQETACAVRFGCSSFSSEDWVGPFYPEGTRPAEFLRYYARQFDTVEIDATYYAIPSARTVDGWYEKTGEDFLVSAKFPRSIVHAGRGPVPDPSSLLLPDTCYADRDAFLEVMARLSGKLGPLVLQFPYFNQKTFAGPGPFVERLTRFLDDLPAGFDYAVEIRNRQWVTPGFVQLLRDRRVGMVLVDQSWMPHADELMEHLDPVTGSVCYIRLLGDRKEIEAITKHWDKEVLDREDRMRRWVRVLDRLRKQKVPALVYVNNHYAGHAPATLRRLQQLYSRSPGAPA